MASPSSQKLSQAATSVMPVNRCFVKPSEAFMLTDQTISSSPATRRSDQAMDGDESEGMVESEPFEVMGATALVRPNV